MTPAGRLTPRGQDGHRVKRSLRPADSVSGPLTVNGLNSLKILVLTCVMGTFQKPPQKVSVWILSQEEHTQHAWFIHNEAMVKSHTLASQRF